MDIANNKKLDSEMNNSSDNMVFAEKSLFGTRLPRPTNIGLHIAIALITLILSLIIAIFYAEHASNLSEGEPLQSSSR